MADIGLDYAGSSPGSGAVKAAGFNFVARYLSRYSWKTIKKPEYDDMTSNGVGVCLVFEDGADNALNGYNQGVSDAQYAVNEANALGWPSTRPIYFAVDFDINDAQKPVAGAYMQGVISVLGLGRTGTYGGYWWIKYCVENNLAGFFWQAYAWSGGNVHPSAHLFQRLGGTTVNGTSCDIDDALKNDYGSNKGENDMVPDENHLQAMFRAFRGRAASPEEVNMFVGKWTYSAMVEALDASQERADTVHALDVGKIAVRDKWDQQIYGLEDALKASQAQDDADKKALADETTKEQALQAELDKINSTPMPTPQPTPDPTPAPKQSFWAWLVSLFQPVK